MKKDLIFAPALILVAVALGLLKVTGIYAHIAISVIGLALLIVYTVQTKKEWKIPALEVLMRVFYALALISGIAIMAGCPTAAVGIAHRITAALFGVLLVVLFVIKLAKKNK